MDEACDKKQGEFYVISFENVSKTFLQGDKKVMALKNVTLKINEGEIFGVIGYSGAGKSTLLRCINMLERPTSGTVKVAGVDMGTLTQRELLTQRRKIGMIFQHFNLLSSSTVFDNVAAPLRLAHASRKEITEKVGQLLEVVRLSKQANAYPAQLSGGQKQRVGIARALASNPAILLCDEATSALDPETTASILNLLLDINKKFHITIVLVTHEMNVIKAICDRVAVMEHGAVIEQGYVVDLFTNPQTQTARKFISTVIDVMPSAQLTEKVKKLLDVKQLFQVSFVGEDGMEPVLADLALKFQVRPNILYGSITEVKDMLCGTFVVSLSGEDEQIANSVQFFKDSGLHVKTVTL